MSDKDFLSQFSGSNKKPDSFKEEERIKVTKEKKPVNVKLIVIILAIVLAIVGIVLFFMFRPTIEVREFVGEDSSEVKAWIKQNEIETQGIIFREEYSFDYDEGYIISQSIEAGKKIRKDAKMDFVVSKGADPEELVSVPDIMSMYKDELQEWVKENKLTKTKVMSAYSDDVESGAVISYEFKNGADAENFKRSSTLTITVSKGPQPAGTVTVDDFVKQDYSVVEAWGKKNKVEIIKTTKYDDKIAKDLVISQSIEPKKNVKEGESLTVVVSLGKGVQVPDFATMSDSDVDDWLKDNASYVKVKEMYSDNDAYIIKQSIATGKYIGEDNKLEITKNLGDHFYLSDVVNEFTSYDKLKDFCENLSEKGLYIDTHRNYIDSEKPKNTIISINKIYSGSIEYSEVQKLPLEIDIEYNISNGYLADNVFIEKTYIESGTEYSWQQAIDEKYSEAKVRKLCELSGANYVIEINELDTSNVDVDEVSSIKILDKDISEFFEKYINKESDIIVVTVNKYTVPSNNDGEGV